LPQGWPGGRRNVVDSDDVEERTNAAPAGDRRWEAHAVDAVVDEHDAVRVRRHLVQQRHHQGEREKAVRNGRPEGPGRGRDGIDVDALPVLGRVGEQVDPLLVDLEPPAGAEAGADLDHDASPQRTMLAAQV
jgi:hypothetical protein